MKVTTIRVALVELLADRGLHMTAEEITAELRALNYAVDRVTVYRNIERMLREGILLADLVPGRALRVALCSQPGKFHHHHIVCDVCGQVTEVDGCFLADQWDTVSGEVRRRTGYKLNGHLMQYAGTCPSCLEAQPSAAP
jgi:Fur family ferric uptake transcriptional regulator